MPTYPLATLAPTIDATGISSPEYNDIYQSLIASFQNIYGSSVYVAPDSQDGQWIAILAKAIYDSNQAAVAVFQSFSPTFSQGENLSSLVKINGILRQIPSYSSSQGNVIGVAGTIIINGVVQDVSGNLWNLPSAVTIPVGGLITVTVIAQKLGMVIAPSGTINKIANPQYGWQSFNSTIDAVPGAPVESDPLLRKRQTISTSLPALGIKQAIAAAVANVSGVTRHVVYENDTVSTDADGIPAHTISAVVEGGTIPAIGAAIAGRKPPGIQTYGSTSITVYDTIGLPSTINFYALTLIQVYFDITIKALPGYVSTTGSLLISSLVNFVNNLAIGEDIYVQQASAIASLINLPVGQTFYITSFKLGIAPAPTGTTNLVMTFRQAAVLQSSNVALTVT